MGRMSMETRRRVIVLRQRGFKLKDIQLRLCDEGIKVSKTSLCLLIKKYNSEGIIADRLRPPSRPAKLSFRYLQMIDNALDQDDEMTCNDLRRTLRDKGVSVSSSTIYRAKKHLGMFTCSLVASKKSDWIIIVYYG